MNTMIDYVLKYSEVFKVFPLTPNQKHPYLKGGFHNATQDKEQLKTWWNETPEANIGIDLTGTNYFVIDIDIKNGNNGLRTLIETHIPETGTNFIASFGELDLVCYKTPSGGTHIYFKTDHKRISEINATNLYSGVDVYGQDHYLILPPSYYAGKDYEGKYSNITDSGKDLFQYNNIPEAPEWLIKALLRQLKQKKQPIKNNFVYSGKSNRKGRIPQLIEEAYTGIEAGNRNVFFTKAFGILLRANVDTKIAVQVCRDWNENLTDPPLSAGELDHIFKSILTKETRKERC